MKLETIKQEKNPFLEREEFTLEITSQASPSESEVVSQLGKDATLTVVKKINKNFGRQTFLTEVVVYDSLEAKKKVETIPQKIRKKLEAEEKAAAEAAKKKAEEEAAAAVEAAKVEVEASAEEENTEENKEEEKTE